MNVLGTTWNLFGIALSPTPKRSSIPRIAVRSAASTGPSDGCYGVSHQRGAIAWMPDGIHVVFGPGSNIVVLTVAGNESSDVSGTRQPCRAVRSRRRPELLSGSADRTVALFDAITGELKTTCEGHVDRSVRRVTKADASLSRFPRMDTARWNLETGAALAVLDDMRARASLVSHQTTAGDFGCPTRPSYLELGASHDRRSHSRPDGASRFLSLCRPTECTRQRIRGRASSPFGT